MGPHRVGRGGLTASEPAAPSSRPFGDGGTAGPGDHGFPRSSKAEELGSPVALPAMSIARVGIVGSGIMGSGIAETAAVNGFEVVLRSRTQSAADATLAAMEKSLNRQVEKGKKTEAERDEALSRVTVTTALADLKDVDLVIESVIEDLDVKKELFNELDRITAEHTILATNTSTLPVIELAMQTGRPDKVCGVHFFNPAPVMELVEVAKPLTVAEETVAAVRAFAEACGKTPVEVKDQAGFIVNALLFPYLNNAVRLYEQGVASVADIDTAMKGGCGFPMGPFALLDLVGLDTSLAILDALYQEFRDPELRGGAPAASDGRRRTVGPQIGPGLPRLSNVGVGPGRQWRDERRGPHEPGRNPNRRNSPSIRSATSPGSCARTPGTPRRRHPTSCTGPTCPRARQVCPSPSTSPPRSATTPTRPRRPAR